VIQKKPEKKYLLIIFHHRLINKTTFLNLPLVAETVTKEIANILQENQTQTDTNNILDDVKIKLGIKLTTNGGDLSSFATDF